MAGLWQRTGTVTVTNGSKTVTGSGTKWKTGTLPIQKGHTFYGPDNWAYEVDTVVSDTEILLVENYRGGTLANQAYRIDITRTSTISQFAADLASLVAKYRTWFDGMMTWLTGSGDVAILNPDTGANVTIPSWKKVASEGEGQTARAKVEADRAKTEADRALTEADRAAGIVAAAALPLPDVWAPLTDSLRLFTGYGREVKVGDDVVARMLTFTRSTTKTYTNLDGVLTAAAVNAPTFDRRGLLLEGQSQNLVVESEMLPRILQAGSFTVTTSVVQGYNLRSCVYTSGDDAVVVDAYATLQAPNGTCSFVFNAATIVGRWTCYCSDIDNYRVFWPKNSADYAYEDLGNGLIRVSRVLKGTSASVLHFRCGSVVGSRVDIGCFQVEALPFASSYIPTNRAAVTRAADVATLPQSLNLGESQLGFSLAVEFDSVNTGLYRVLELSDQSAIILEGATMTVRHAGKEVHSINAPLGERHHLAYSVATDGTITVALNGKLLAPQSRSVSHPSSKSTIALGNRIAASDRAIYGHLRDLKIWTKKPLTADQLKVASV